MGQNGGKKRHMPQDPVLPIALNDFIRDPIAHHLICGAGRKVGNGPVEVGVLINQISEEMFAYVPLASQSDWEDHIGG